MCKPGKTVFLLPVLMVIISGIKAQTIRVERAVKDSLSKQALPNASIIIKGSNNFPSPV